MRIASKLTIVLCCFLVIGFPQPVSSMEMDLGEFTDHKYDTPVSTEAAMRAPAAKLNPPKLSMANLEIRLTGVISADP